MDFRGIFEDGVVRPTEPVSLPEGSAVDCRAADASAGTAPNGFWNGQSLEALAISQGVRPLRTIKDVQGEWPADESVDDFIKSVRSGRR